MISITVLSVMAVACKNKSANEHDSDTIHEHEDGTTHAPHDNSTPKGQEEFSIDSLNPHIEIKIEKEHDHNDKDGHKHN